MSFFPKKIAKQKSMSTRIQNWPKVSFLSTNFRLGQIKFLFRLYCTFCYVASFWNFVFRLFVCFPWFDLLSYTSILQKEPKNWSLFTNRVILQKRTEKLVTIYILFRQEFVFEWTTDVEQFISRIWLCNYLKV